MCVCVCNSFFPSTKFEEYYNENMEHNFKYDYISHKLSINLPACSHFSDILIKKSYLRVEITFLGCVELILGINGKCLDLR